ncbi:Diguanylate cyclase domain protein, partial [Operophtera brumata]
MDFEEESALTNSSNVEDDVEVKHTILVFFAIGDTGTLTYNIGRKESTKEDSGEVPILTGYKAVETTQIRTPDTRNKPQIPQTPRGFLTPQVYTDSVFISRNIRDDDDIFPNIAINPSQWKPSNFFNNINYWDPSRDSNILRRVDRPAYPNQAKLHRKITEDGMKEFYCRKCRELNCQAYRDAPVYSQNPQPRSWVTTTPKMKIDGKLAKLN